MVGEGLVEDEKVKKIYLGGKKGGFALVDADKYDELVKYKWHHTTTGYAKGYVNKKTISMHTFLMKPPKLMVVDHINREKLDNTKKNLRIITRNENAKNRSKNDKSLNEYKNVFYDKSNKKFRACITYNDEHIYIGNFETAITAAIAVDMHIVHNNMKFSSLNFPDDREKYLNTEYIPYQKKRFKNKYIGVNKYGNKLFKVRVGTSNGRIQICISNSELEGAKEYDKYVVNNNIPNKILNFPLEHPNYNPISVIKTLCEKYDDGTVKLLIKNTKENIKRKNEILIDEKDYELIKYYTCHIGSGGYIYVNTTSKTTLHTFLMNPGPELVVDHINNNRCDNTRKNLRVVATQQNNQNKSKQHNNKSGYIGVSYDKSREKWKVTICFNDKNIHCSRENTKEDAARKRDLYIIEHLPNELYKLNFIWSESDIVYWMTKLKYNNILPSESIIKENKKRAKTIFNNYKDKTFKNYNNESIEITMDNIIKQMELTNNETKNITQRYNDIMKI
jgi:hypothetical protein